MLQTFIDYIKDSSILSGESDIDFSDAAFAYDYNEVQELFFNETMNNYVFIVGETGLRKKDMLARICKDLLMRGIEKRDILYLDYELPILHGEDIFPFIQEVYRARQSSDHVYLLVNEMQESGEWFALVQKIRNECPKLKLLCSSSTPPYIYETIYEQQAEYCKIIVLSQKNASNVKHKSQSFGVYGAFKYNQKDGFIEIKGLTKEGKKMPCHVVPEAINGLPVKVIASGAFHDRSELISVTLPNSIEMIGDYAFSKCTGLKEIRLPKTLTYVGEHAFFGAKNLRSIIGGENVIHVGNSAFYDTEWLKEQPALAVIGKTLYRYLGEDAVVDLPQGIEAVASYSFANSAVERVIATHVRFVGEGAFYNSKKLKHVDIKVSTIPPFAFYGCENLTTEFAVEEVGKFGLHGCSSLTSLAAKRVRGCALAQCRSLKNVIGVVDIEQGALWSCHNLSYLDGSSVQRIGAFALGNTALRSFDFAGSVVGDFALYHSQGLSSVRLMPHVAVGRGAFYKCDQLRVMDIAGHTKLAYYFAGEQPKVEELIVRGNVTDDFSRNNPHLKTLTVVDAEKFGRWSFYNNLALNAVYLAGVKGIGDWAFAYCDGIAKIELPQETEYIGMNAFRYCHNLSEIKILSKTAVPFGANAFYSTVETKRFYVPSVAYDGYFQLPIWQEYLKNLSIINA